MIGISSGMGQHRRRQGLARHVGQDEPPDAGRFRHPTGVTGRRVPQAMDFQGRLDGLALYRHELRLFQNLFLPSVKLVGKERVGARLRRRYDIPRTPLDLGGGQEPGTRE
jgi:hypothetical protein